MDFNMRLFATILFLLFTVSGFSQVSAKDIYIGKDSVSTIQDAYTDLTSQLGHRSFQSIIDGRYHVTTQTNLDNYYEQMYMHDNGYKTVLGAYYLDASLNVPSELWEMDSAYKYLYYLDWSNVTGTASLPDIPSTADNFSRLYINVRRTTGNSMGSAGISDVPTTWRNAKDLYRISFERQELTSAQQLGIIAGLEREILAGLCENYTSTSTTARIIDFQSASTGANDDLIQADLVALGWTVVNATTLRKDIASNGGTPRRWRVLHN